jgi:uncharacterized protein YkwD
MKIFSWIIFALSSLLITAGSTVLRLANPQPIVSTSTPTVTVTEPEPVRQTQSLESLVNGYRSANGRSALATSGTLCRIAATRMANLSAAGGLDNHAGFAGQAQSQKEFSNMGEILQYRWPPVSNETILYTGWAGSKEHDAVLLAPGWTHGCGATDGSFAVFIFGKK